MKKHEKRLIDASEKQDNQEKVIVSVDREKTHSLCGKVAFSVALLKPGADFQTGNDTIDDAALRPFTARCYLRDALDVLDIMQGDLRELSDALFQAELAVERGDEFVALKELSKVKRAYQSLMYWFGRRGDTEIADI